MASAPRYELVDLIAKGDFASVYRGRDRELGREVAIKQIHGQFLADPQQLARYWQEAQLLASLQHANILTIYDIVRPRGWLILELMQSSLKQVGQAGPIDLDFLRVVLIGCLNGLGFLHSGGVIHGDVKPSNILVAPPNRIKLGDFGLARRASNEEGSLLKGTTKYMAPELLSPQFGAIGPPSDIYSLGFAAYELMCGGQFESLLPGLATFGRDKQIAWMMWHAAADLKLPEIQRILEGVPDDLAQVVQKMIVKDQSLRYQSAQEALRDLRKGQRGGESEPPRPDPAAEALAMAAARRKRRIRYAAIAAVAFSLMLCLAIFWPRKPAEKPQAPPPTRGVVTNVYPEEYRIAIARGEDGKPELLPPLVPKYDKVFINDEPRVFRDLQPHDTVVIDDVFDSRAGRKIKEVRAFRPVMHKGRIRVLKADEARFVLAVGEGEDQGKELSIAVPSDLRITFNGKPDRDGRPVKLADLKPDAYDQDGKQLEQGDRVVVHHVGQETGRKATEVAVQRVVSEKGIIREIDAKKGALTLSLGGDDANRLTLPFAPQCQITLNNQAKLNERLLKPADLLPGDQVTVAHDVQIVRVDAHRVLGQVGTIQKVQHDARLIDVLMVGQPDPVRYSVDAQCKITLGGEPVELGDLRDRDVVDVRHRDAVDNKPESATGSIPRAISITATRPADNNRFAVVIAGQNYDDKSLTPLGCALADATLLTDALVKRYRVPAGQVTSLADVSRVRLAQAVPEQLAKIPADAWLIVYAVGHAFKDDKGAVYLACKDFDLKRPSITGLPLQELVDQVEACQAKEKLLLLDCTQSGAGADLAMEPSAADMLRTLNAPPGQAALRTVTAIASCSTGERNLLWPEKGHGLFAWFLAEGYAGRADPNRDNHLEPTELFGYLQREMPATAGKLGARQTPALFLQDDRPPRLTEEAKKSIRHLASLLGQTKVDLETADQAYPRAVKLAGKEVEPRLVMGLLLMKAKDRERAVQQFEQTKLEFPDLLLPREALVWLRFDKRTYQAGTDELIGLVGRVPRPAKAGEAYPVESQQVLFWAGQLREFVGEAVQENLRPSAESLANLDSAVGKPGDAAASYYSQGRDRSKTVLADFDRRIAAAGDEATAKTLKVKRWLLANYAAFPVEKFAQQVLAGLDQ